MFTIILGIIGYFVADGPLGVLLISAFTWILVGYGIAAIITGMLVTAVIYRITVQGAKRGYDKADGIGAIIGTAVGGGMSVLLGAFVALRIIFLIISAQYLITNIDPTITTMGQIEPILWLVFCSMIAVHLLTGKHRPFKKKKKT